MENTSRKREVEYLKARGLAENPNWRPPEEWWDREEGWQARERMKRLQRKARKAGAK